VRALGSHIKGTNGKSQGVVPFLKVVNDTAVAVNQGGKRKGAVCSYLETWHLDIEEFLELRKNTGDDRRRTHDMNTSNWIPDLFMKRVMEAAEWTLFSPADAPDLHDKVGKEFEAAYVEYERRATVGELKLFKRVPALTIWRKMLTMLFETGHPWITFKDPCNIRSPQQHVGMVHSSNLCTEITLNTSESEIAVCNLGSVNLVAHIKDGKLDQEKLRNTVSTAMRMLDNVIDINYLPPSTRRATPISSTGRWGSASWVSRIACTKCAWLTAPGRPWNSPTVRWRRWLTTRIGPRQSWPRNAAAIPLMRAPCGPRGFSRRIRSGFCSSSAETMSTSTHRQPLIGSHCVPVSDSSACAIPTVWQSRRRRR